MIYEIRELLNENKLNNIKCDCNCLRNFVGNLEAILDDYEDTELVECFPPRHGKTYITELEKYKMAWLTLTNPNGLLFARFGPYPIKDKIIELLKEIEKNFDIKEEK